MRKTALLTLSLGILLPIGFVAMPEGSAQAIFEAGSLYGKPGGGAGGLDKALGNLYGGSRNTPPSARPGRTASPAARFDSEDLAKFTTQAQKAYAAAKQAEKAGKPDVAIKEYGTAIVIRERVWGLQDPAIAEMARRQAELHKAAGRPAEAEKCYRKVLSAEIRKFGPGTQQLLPTLTALGELCDQQSKNRDALDFYKQVYALRLKQGSKGIGAAHAALLKLINLLTFTEDYSGAEQLLKQNISAEESSATPNKQWLSQAYKSYGALMRAQGKEEEAQRYEAQSKAGEQPLKAPEPETKVVEPVQKDSATQPK